MFAFNIGISPEKSYFPILFLENRNMMKELFSGWFESLDRSGIPNIKDPDKPWEILSQSFGGIVAQIEEEHGQNGVFIHPTAEIDDSVRIEGPCFIGENSEIRHSAFLRRGSWICEGVVVGHCSEIKNSLLLPGSKVPHFNYVGDSILGSEVNLGAGAILSNVRHDGKEISLGLEGRGKIPTGFIKLGALIGDRAKLGCNVVTNPGTIVLPSSMIPPNLTISGFYPSS